MRCSARGPEIADGLVEIRGVAREPGYRSKIAVESHMQGVDPVGACVGPRGSRVRWSSSELRGRRSTSSRGTRSPLRREGALPARVREVYIDDETREATVVVPDDQLALAIGKEGLNARLATRLTGWKIDIESETEFAQPRRKRPSQGTRRRGLLRPLCRDPLERQALPERDTPGSRYRGVPAHQALVGTEPEAQPGAEEAAEPAETIESSRSRPRPPARAPTCPGRHLSSGRDGELRPYT